MVLPAGVAPAASRLSIERSATELRKEENGSPAWTRTKTLRINNPMGYYYPTGECERVDAGGNAPLVGSRTILQRRVYRPRSGTGSLLEKWWQAPVMLRVVRVMSPESGLPGLRLKTKLVAVAGVAPAF